jgi:hypothetical protein
MEKAAKGGLAIIFEEIQKRIRRRENKYPR